METNLISTFKKIASAFIQTQGKDESIAELLPQDYQIDFQQRHDDLNHFRCAFAWTLEDLALIVFEQTNAPFWENVADTLSWASDDYTEQQWQELFDYLKSVIAIKKK